MEKKGMKYFSIPLKGLKNGNHHFRFEINSDFFEYFENKEIEAADLHVNFTIDKEDNVSTMIFEVEGTIAAVCDRCTADIHLPLEGHYVFMLKYGDKENSTEEVIFIDPETSVYSVAEIIYECIILSIPMMNIYDCEAEDVLPCNQKVLERLESGDEDEKVSSIWDNLKDLDLNDN